MKTMRLYNQRVVSGYSQQELAEKIGIAQQQYARYESGVTKCPIKYLKRLCIELDVSADYLLGLSDTKERQ